MRVLITDGNERGTLAAARSLVRAGHAVCVAAPTRVSLAGVSRGVRPRRLTTDPLTDPAAYAAEVGRVAQQEGSELLLPMTDPAVEAVLEHAATLPAAAFPVLLQRRIAGIGEGFFALRWGGRAVAMFAHRRLREKPPAGGVSVYRESIALPDGLVGAGLRLLEALDWRGVAMIECK